MTDFVPPRLKTQDEITVNFATGGWRADIRVNGQPIPLRRIAFEMPAGEPSLITLESSFCSLPNQRGYFVSEDDMAEFLRWKLSKGRT